jgi:hypothetical protein
MPKPNFPHKLAAPSVPETISPAIARSRGLPREEHPMTQREIVEDILGKLSLPESIRQDLKKRHGL